MAGRGPPCFVKAQSTTDKFRAADSEAQVCGLVPRGNAGAGLAPPCAPASKTRSALRVLPVMRARRLRGLHLAAGQGAHLEDALEAHRWLAIRLPRRARLPCRSAGASTGDGGRPARFIWCIHNCDLARNWIVSVVGLDFKW